MKKEEYLSKEKELEEKHLLGRSCPAQLEIVWRKKPQEVEEGEEMVLAGVLSDYSGGHIEVVPSTY